MTSYNSLRRDFLRVGGIGMAAAAIPSVYFAATADDSKPAATLSRLSLTCAHSARRETARRCKRRNRTDCK